MNAELLTQLLPLLGVILSTGILTSLLTAASQRRKTEAESLALKAQGSSALVEAVNTLTTVSLSLITPLQAQLQEHERARELDCAELEELRTSVAELHQTVTELTGMLAVARSEIEHLKGELARTLSYVATLQEQRRSLEEALHQQRELTARLHGTEALTVKEEVEA
jgi:chromosome segregation ATPase